MHLLLEEFKISLKSSSSTRSLCHTISPRVRVGVPLDSIRILAIQCCDEQLAAGGEIVRGTSGENVPIPMQDYKSVCVAVMICVNLVNTQTHRQRLTGCIYSGQLSQLCWKLLTLIPTLTITILIGYYYLSALETGNNKALYKFTFSTLLSNLLAKWGLWR